MDSKEVIVPSNITGKRVNFPGRTVAGPATWYLDGVLVRAKEKRAEVGGRNVRLDIPGNSPQAGLSAYGSALVITTRGGRVWGLGDNISDMFNLGTTDVVTEPTEIGGLPDINVVHAECGEFFVCVMDNNGSLWINNTLRLGRQLNPFRRMEGQPYGIVDFRCGYDFVVVLDSNGDVWGYGGNESRQFGSNYSNRGVFTRLDLPFKTSGLDCGGNYDADNSYIMYIDTNGYLWTAGTDIDGRMGLGNTEDRTQTLTRVSRNVTVKYVACGQHESWVIDQNNNLWGTGFGNGRFKRVFENIAAVSAGITESVALGLDGSVWEKSVDDNFRKVDGVSAIDIECGGNAIMYKRF